MSKTFDEIDRLLRRANKLYLGYTILSLSTTGYLFSLTKLSKPKKILGTLCVSILVSGMVTWVHILRTFTLYELTYLRVGLDKSYPSLKSKKNSK